MKNYCILLEKTAIFNKINSNSYDRHGDTCHAVPQLEKGLHCVGVVLQGWTTTMSSEGAEMKRIGRKRSHP